MGLSVYSFNKFLLNTHYMLGIWGYNRARDTHDSTFMKIIMEKKQTYSIMKETHW